MGYRNKVARFDITWVIISGL